MHLQNQKLNAKCYVGCMGVHTKESIGLCTIFFPSHFVVLKVLQLKKIFFNLHLFLVITVQKFAQNDVYIHELTRVHTYTIDF
jgi:hypothetical protein